MEPVAIHEVHGEERTHHDELTAAGAAGTHGRRRRRDPWRQRTRRDPWRAARADEIHGVRHCRDPRWAAPAAGGGRRRRATQWQQAATRVAELRQRTTALGSSTATGSDVGQIDGDGRRSRGPAADVDARQLDGDGRRC